MSERRSHFANWPARRGKPRRSPYLQGQVIRQLLQTKGAIRQRAETRMEDHRVKTGEPVDELRPAVLIPEELRIRETGAKDAFVPGDDFLAPIRRLHVRNHDEARREVAVPVDQGEVFLMRPHRRRQHLRWQLHEFRVDVAEQDDRPFDEAGDFLEQAAGLA